MEYEVDIKGLRKMYHSLYWKQIFNFKTSLRVKWVAIKSLWYMRKLTRSDSPKF